MEEYFHCLDLRAHFEGFLIILRCGRSPPLASLFGLFGFTLPLVGSAIFLIGLKDLLLFKEFIALSFYLPLQNY